MVNYLISGINYLINGVRHFFTPRPRDAFKVSLRRLDEFGNEFARAIRENHELVAKCEKLMENCEKDPHGA